MHGGVKVKLHAFPISAQDGGQDHLIAAWKETPGNGDIRFSGLHRPSERCVAQKNMCPFQENKPIFFGRARSGLVYTLTEISEHLKMETNL